MNKKRRLDGFFDETFRYKKHIYITFDNKTNYIYLSLPAKILHEYIKLSPDGKCDINDIFLKFATTNDEIEAIKDLIEELYKNNLVKATLTDCTEHICNF